MNDTSSSNITDFLYRRIAPAEGETQNDLRRIGQDILWAFWLLKKKKKTKYYSYSYSLQIFSFIPVHETCLAVSISIILSLF